MAFLELRGGNLTISQVSKINTVLHDSCRLRKMKLGVEVVKEVFIDI